MQVVFVREGDDDTTAFEILRDLEGRGFNVDHATDANAGANLIDVHVRTLRPKLDGEGLPRLLHTARGVG